MAEPELHAFERRPHRTLLALTLPVLLSLLVEPLTGLVDTAFVARLGAAELAALGAGATLVTSLFWIFNFLGVGTQTEVAHALGARDPEAARASLTLALALAAGIGLGVALAGWPAADALARWMSAEPAVQTLTAAYLRIRLLSAPALLLLLAGFGALRGAQDMKTPLWIAAGANALNAGLDPLLIFGAGPLPALGLAGAAWASTAAVWLGALATLAAVRRRLGLAERVPWAATPSLLRVGRDLFLRTGLLTLFLLLATRAATRLGPEAGAAHQAVRQVWLLSAFVLDAYAASAQSLVGYFLGARRVAQARGVAALACGWALASGLALGLAFWALEGFAARLLVPPAAHAVFGPSWQVLALLLPASALSFATDGIHWGTRDYTYLRNAMLLSSAAGVALLALWARGPQEALVGVWWATAAWIALRALLGVVRVWPGWGAAPLGAARAR